MLKELTAAVREPLAANKAGAEQYGVITVSLKIVHVRDPCDDLVRQLWWKVRASHLVLQSTQPILSRKA